MNLTLLIIALAIPLLIAVGFVMYVLASFGHDFAADWFRKRTPTRSIEHPQFGRLTLEDDSWGGSVQHNGETIYVMVDNTDDAPDLRQLKRLDGLLARIDELERVAVAFIRSDPEIRTEEPQIATYDFRLYMLYPWLDEAHGFVLEFIVDGDHWLDRVWHVQFENGRPAHVGFDD